MSQIAILLPAAGASRRMLGRDKLLEEIDDTPLLRRTAERAVATGARVFVTLPPDHARRAVLQGLALDTVIVPDAVEGMSASLRRGVAALPAGTNAVMILPADMPQISSDDMASMITAYRGNSAILRAATSDGKPGHPVIFPAKLFPAFAKLTGDRGAQSIVQDNAGRVLLHPLASDHARVDLDTPEAWEAWRAANNT